jgi:type II secretory pathway pseudopilin PulG
MMMTRRGHKDQRGMTLFAVMAVMTVTAVGLMAVAPSVYQEIQREKELEAIRRGEEIADAIRQYVEFYRGTRLPNSIDDLLEGLPQGTKKKQILRASAAIDPLSEDGRWRLVKADVSSLGSFARRVQNYNNGQLPSNPSPTFDRYTIMVMNSLNLETDGDATEPDDSIEMVTDNTPFIGVASQSRSRAILSYYGAENHSKWVFTPLFRGTRPQAMNLGPRPPIPPRPQPPNR